MTDPSAQTLCATIEDAGHVALFVGGCVRNALLHQPASDIDIATDATPVQVMTLVQDAGLRCVPTGVAHGTVTVVADGRAYEVTTFRRDVSTDGRRAVVAFSNSIEEDARRRDFTMNALYADRTGAIVDPLGGLPDVQAGHVRFIEDAAQRIREDYLRTLRFFRFHAWYAAADAGFDADALAGIAANLDGLSTLSAERVGAELTKLLSAPDPAPALGAMAQTGVLATVLPGADPTLVAPLVRIEQDAAVAPDPMTRLAALGGEHTVTRLRLSRAKHRRFDLIRTYAVSPFGARAVGHLLGQAAGIGALALRAAMANQMLPPDTAKDVAHGATTDFPVKASDLPKLQGKALGDKLADLKQQWLGSNLSKSKNTLLGR
ncbi:MAG: CCA tRNA nucleotidyltransferase [Pseudomonadota bacterium]